MILADTSVIVAWLDRSHEDHPACSRALEHWAGQDQLAVSALTYAELAAGGRTRQAVEEDLRDFERVRKPLFRARAAEAGRRAVTSRTQILSQPRNPRPL